MASYEELADLRNFPRLKDQVRVAVVVAASDISLEDPATVNHANRLIWARWTLRTPETAGRQMRPAVLALNQSATVNQIQTATDAVVQANVNATVDLFADGSQDVTAGQV